MANPTTLATERLATCPACRKDIIATVQVSLDLPSGIAQQHHDGNWEAKAGVQLLGLRVDHDCIPPVTR